VAASEFYEDYLQLGGKEQGYLNRKFGAIARRIGLETRDKNKLGEGHKTLSAIIWPDPEKEKALDEQYPPEDTSDTSDNIGLKSAENEHDLTHEKNVADTITSKVSLVSLVGTNKTNTNNTPSQGLKDTIKMANEILGDLASE
jgi:hypothetical protein